MAIQEHDMQTPKRLQREEKSGIRKVIGFVLFAASVAIIVVLLIHFGAIK